MKHLFLSLGFAALIAANPIERGAAWLLATQGRDGGWGQDGGATSHIRHGQNLETNGNDVANTAVATLALFRANRDPRAIRKGVEFILSHVERSAENGLAITSIQGTQIQGKLGPYIDTFLTSMLLSEVDGKLNDAVLNRRVRAALERCVRKIEAGQLSDGSWNHAGGWAPVLGTSIASRSLHQAKERGVRVNEQRLDQATHYAANNARQIASNPSVATAAAAGVALYDRAQILEQLSRTESGRRDNRKAIQGITADLQRQEVVNGFGSMGGEEFFSYLNISDSLRRTGGEPWEKWRREITAKLSRLQNADGTWAGHHCITGRVAVTAAAMLTLQAAQ